MPQQDLPLTPETALLKAVIALLTNDAGVKARVDDRIYDDVPDDRDGNARRRTPYIYAGPINRTRVEGGCAAAWNIRARLYAVSTDFGRIEAWAVMDAAALALEEAQLVLDAPFTTMGEIVRVVQAGDVIEPSNPKATFIDIATLVARGAA